MTLNLSNSVTKKYLMAPETKFVYWCHFQVTAIHQEDSQLLFTMCEYFHGGK